MNDALDPQFQAPPQARKPVARPRDAASLILLRGERDRLEVLVGRRPLSARFMPGVYVFPGGAIDPPDRKAWGVESSADNLSPRLMRAARAAIRETWEEVGVLIGQPDAAPLNRPAKTAIERAYREHGLVAALDRLIYIGRAITPSHSFRRFNTRFFLADGGSVVGEPAPSAELEDAGWRPIEQSLLDGFRDVTRFMLARAMALRAGTAAAEPPLFYWGKNARRIGVCREARR
ncbi:MAG TPA: NUDIX domain-containing protein [Stellaceae bacterium]